MYFSRILVVVSVVVLVFSSPAEGWWGRRRRRRTTPAPPAPDYPPRFTNCPSGRINKFYRTTEARGHIVHYSTPPATDERGGWVVRRTSGLSSGSRFPEGTSLVSFEVTDTSGKKAYCHIAIKVTVLSTTSTTLTPAAEGDFNVIKITVPTCGTLMIIIMVLAGCCKWKKCTVNNAVAPKPNLQGKY